MNKRFASRCRNAGALKLIVFLAAIQALFTPLLAHALPAYARQTGQQCAACHAGGQFPELTQFGRLFKLTGYTMGTHKMPVSVMGVASYTKSHDPVAGDDAFAKDAVALFQTGSVFVAGKITDKVGLFSQFTYNNYDSRNPDSGKWEGKWASDNLDLRYADNFTISEKNVIAGLSLNNNPSVADPWNTVPAWINYVPTAFGVTGPDAAPVVSQLGQQAAGISAYALWNQTLYAEISAYKTANGIWSFMSHGTADADQVKIKGAAPYLRLALTRDWDSHHAMIGLLAMNADVYPDNLAPAGPTIAYRDRGIDAQYQYMQGAHTATAQASFIRENIDNGDVTGIATNASNTLNQFKTKGSYVYNNKYGGGLGYFNTTGSSDAMLYGDPAANPGTRGWIPEVFWIPVQNMRIGAQYFAFSRFHGASNNYDGAGRNAKDNNTLFVYLWAAY